MTSWTVALQAPLSVDFFSQEYWSGLPFPPPGDLPDWGMEPESLVSPVLAGRFFTTVPSGKPSMYQDILPFYGWVRFHCKYIPHFCLSIPLFMDSWHPILSHKPRVGGGVTLDPSLSHNPDIECISKSYPFNTPNTAPSTFPKPLLPCSQDTNTSLTKLLICAKTPFFFLVLFLPASCINHIIHSLQQYLLGTFLYGVCLQEAWQTTSNYITSGCY